MRKFGHLILAVALAFLLSGCFTHTVIGDGIGTAAPDGRFTLAISSHGASRKAYVDTTKKHVYVWIKPISKENQKTLFFGEYVFTGADLEWDTRWQGAQAVTVDFYDLGDKVSRWDAKKKGVSSNYIATLNFLLDAKTGTFIEKK